MTHPLVITGIRYYNTSITIELNEPKEGRYVLTKEELPACPVAATLELVGSKWKLLILRNLLARPWRFNEMRKTLPGISQKVLTDSLRSMEADGIITRKCLPASNML